MVQQTIGPLLRQIQCISSKRALWPGHPAPLGGQGLGPAEGADVTDASAPALFQWSQLCRNIPTAADLLGTCPGTGTGLAQHAVLIKFSHIIQELPLLGCALGTASCGPVPVMGAIDHDPTSTAEPDIAVLRGHYNSTCRSARWHFIEGGESCMCREWQILDTVCFMHTHQRHRLW